VKAEYDQRDHEQSEADDQLGHEGDRPLKAALRVELAGLGEVPLTASPCLDERA